MERGFVQLQGYELTCLLDSKVGSNYGGTEQSLDWHIAKAVAERFPVLVAGELTPDNVRYVITEVRPWGVDVSSGVESNGHKDMKKISAFIEEVKKER